MEQESIDMKQKFDLSLVLNSLFVLYAFVLPLSRASVGIATLLIIILFLFSRNIKVSLKKIWKNPASRSIVIFVLFYFLTLLWLPLSQLKEGFRYLVPYLYLLPAVIMYVSVKKSYIPRILSALILGMVVSEVISYGIYLEWWEREGVFVINPSPFMHHIQYSTFLAFTALVILYRVLNEKILYYRAAYGFFFIALTGTLFLTNGRTGQLAFLIGLFLLGFMHFPNKLKALWVSLLLSAAVLFSAYQLSDTFKERISMTQSDMNNMIEKENFGTSLGYRTGVTILSIPLIQQHPILGNGVVDTMPLIREEAERRFPDDYWLKRANHLQNQYLQVVVEVGVVGLSILMMMLYQIGRIPLRADSYRTIKSILLIVFFITMLFDIQLHIQFTAGLFALMSGLILAQSRVEHEEMSRSIKEPRLKDA
ncbi:MAG: O-antigen ligase family protein [Campylobacterota bacterium]|nr:O-antigen ligase family protein [Campylobacterota bacterium]